MKEHLKSVHSYATDHDIQSAHAFYLLLVAVLAPLAFLNPEGLLAIGVVLFVTSPLWFTPALIYAIWNLWLDYIQLQFLAQDDQKGQLYELIVPKTVHKSPKAMELFFEGLLLTQGEGTGFDKYWKGRVRPWFSLEIVGKEGSVKMYLWCWERYKEHVEAHLYAQYPEVKMVPVEDYTDVLPYNSETHFAWGMRYKLSDEEALPIKTYYDFGLHENADRVETKIDPMVNMLERFALAGEGEQIWMQILFQKSDRDVANEAEELIDKIYADKSPEYPDPSNPDEKLRGMALLTPTDRAKVEAVHRVSTKPAFDCIIRSVYYADKEHHDTLRIQSIVKMFANYNGFNSFAPDGVALGGSYPWQDYTLPSHEKVMNTFIRAYQLRSGFRAPYKRPAITLSTEELATIFHFPSEEGAVPGMDKSHARSAAPPSNLPTG